MNSFATRNRSDGASFKRARNEVVGVCESPVESGAFIVGLRQCEEDLACAHRARIYREINYLFVKELGAETVGRSAHQACCSSNVHVIESEPPAVAGGCSLITIVVHILDQPTATADGSD